MKQRKEIIARNGEDTTKGGGREMERHKDKENNHSVHIETFIVSLYSGD